MKKPIFFSVILFLVIFNTLFVVAKVDTVWTSSDIGSEVQFQHPVTKDLVLIGVGNKLKVIDSKDGKIIRNTSIMTSGGSQPGYISPDGTKLLLPVMDNTYIYDYPSLDLIYRLDSCRFSKIINNDEVIGRNFHNSRLIKYNLKTKERQEVIPEGSVQDIATSWDGRFIAYSTNPINNNDKPARLILMDAKTMKEITVIDEVKYHEHWFGNFHFSKDGKYLAYNGGTREQYLKIFDVDTRKTVKIYDTNEYNFTSAYIRFLNERLYIFYRKNSVDEVILTQLIDISTDKTIFTMNGGMTGPAFNDELNHLYYFDDKYYCLNLTDVITGVSSAQDNVIIKYENKQLIINKENVRKVEISDISGRLILNQVIDNPFSTNVVLPINLINGSYLINITTDKETFTHKLLIGE